MLRYSPTHKQVIYDLPDLPDPSRILALIPEARRLSSGMTAVPLTLRNGQILRHIGMDAVSPIEYEYDYPSRYPKPRPNQLIASAFKTLYPRNIDTSEQRTGKTLSSLWAADYLMQQGAVHRCLIITTLSTMKNVWETEVVTSFYGRRNAIILHGSREKRLQNLAQPRDYYIINHDGLGIGLNRKGKRLELGDLAQQIIARTDIDLFIFDEISAYKHAGSDRFKVAERVIQGKPYAWVWGLTGTPAATSPTDAYAIGRLVYGVEKRPESYKTFRQRTMVQVSEFKWRPKREAEEIVAQWLQPSIRFTRAQLGYPPLSYETIEVPLSEKQAKAYATMRKDLQITMANGDKIDAVNEAVLRSKLIQISCGAVYDKDHDIHVLDAKPRLDALVDIIENNDKKVLVFAPLTSAINLIYNYLNKKFSCERIVGSVSLGRRNEILRRFQEEDELRVIISDPQPLAHGLNLSTADRVVWFGPTDNLEHYEQANMRIDSPQTCGLVTHIASTPIEREIYRRQREKQALQGSILSLLEDG